MAFIDRFRQAPDPQEPASPPPFDVNERVRVVAATDDAMFTDGLRGLVVGVEYTPDDETFGPWKVDVLPDGFTKPLAFAVDELRRDEPEEDFAADQAIPYTVVEQVGPDREQLPTSVWHDSSASPEARQIERLFADTTEKSLREWTAQHKDAS